MSKKRTKNQKQNVHYPFLISWQGSSKKTSSKAPVKRESKDMNRTQLTEANQPKNADILAKDGETEIIKKDIRKSLITTSLILILELVVYLAWKRIY